MRLRKAIPLFAALVAIGVAAGGCGRKGDLDRPGSSAPVNTKSTAPGGETKEATPDRPFLLDPLL